MTKTARLTKLKLKAIMLEKRPQINLNKIAIGLAVGTVAAIIIARYFSSNPLIIAALNLIFIIFIPRFKEKKGWLFNKLTLLSLWLSLWFILEAVHGGIVRASIIMGYFLVIIVAIEGIQWYISKHWDNTVVKSIRESKFVKFLNREITF